MTTKIITIGFLIAISALIFYLVKSEEEEEEENNEN